MHQDSSACSLLRFLASTLTLSFATACGSAAKNNEAVRPGKELRCPSGSVNAGQTILTMDCNTVVQFEGHEFEATLDAKYVAAGLHNAPRVLRDIDAAATDAQVQFTQTCRVYNSCQMKSDDFQRELSTTQAHFRELREKLMLLSAAQGNPEAVRATLADAYEMTVPPETRKQATLAAQLTVQAKDTPGDTPRILKDGDTLHTGAQVVVGVDVSQPAYVYVFQYHQDQELDVLFPNPAISRLTNPLPAEKTVRIPPGGQVFTLNDEDLGAERIYIAASLRPLDDLQAALQGESGQPGSAPVEQAMGNLFGEGNPACGDSHRGLTVTDEPCGSMSRGLQIASDEANDFFDDSGSSQARTAPGDDVVLQSLSFNHVL